MRRVITGFHQDGEGDWVAELDCLHAQHVRHRPPLWPNPWVLSPVGRAARTGTALDCPPCDRAEPPDGLVVTRIAGPFDVDSLPAGLRRPHQVADRTWGRLHVLDGEVQFTMATEPLLDVRLAAGNHQPIPPGVEHRVSLGDGSVIEIEFLVAP